MAKITKEEIEQAIVGCLSFRELVTRLGRSPNGGNIAIMQKRCQRLGVDVSMLLGKAHRRGLPVKPNRPLEEIFVERDPAACRVGGSTLKRALLRAGVPYKCEQCGIAEWQGQALTLHVDHKDGKYWNNQKENLRFLCPNCHSLTPTWCAKNINKASIR